jgi:hypothetical protein
MKFKALHGVFILFFILFLFLLSRLFFLPPTEAFGERARKEFESDTRASSGLFLLVCLVWFGSVWLGLLFDWLWLID